MKILVITGLDPAPLRAMGDLPPEVEVEIVTARDIEREEALREKLSPARGVILERATLGRAGIQYATNCLALVIAGPASSAQVDRETARRLGIMVASIPDFATEEIAARISARIITHSERLTREATATTRGTASRPLRVGLIGFGEIGRAVARSLTRTAADGSAAFEIRAHDPFVPEEPFRQTAAVPATLVDLLSMSDIISVQCSFAPSLEGMIGAEELKLMKPGAGLITVSDPRLTDETAARAMAGGGRLSFCERVEENWHDDPSVRLRIMRRAIRIVTGCARGEQPPHLLIDPAFPRIFAGAGGRLS